MREMIEKHTKTYWELSRLLKHSMFAMIRHKAFDQLLDMSLEAPTNRLREAAKGAVFSVTMEGV